jgi:hypothetical protein
MTAMIIIELTPLGRGRFRGTVPGGDVLVERSRDPEHDAARELIRRGITGKFATRWSGSPWLATKPRDIEAAAAWSIEDQRRHWQPFSETAREARQGGTLDLTSPT